MPHPQVVPATPRPPRRPIRYPLLLAVGLLAAQGALGAPGDASESDAAPAAAPATAPHRGPRAELRALELLRKQDPFERINRKTYKFNDVLDRAVTRPIARGYRAVVPVPVRKAISNFVANLEYPTVILNDALQGKLRDAADDALRFVMNSTIGIGGLADPATHFCLISHDEDFGQTLGHWGVPAGPYLVLPFLGPSDLRDGPARYVDHFTNLEYRPKSDKTDYVLIGIGDLDLRTSLLAADEAIEGAFDPYTLVRNAYLARREYKVRDGVMPEEDYDEPTDAPVDASPAATATGTPQDPAPQP